MSMRPASSRVAFLFAAAWMFFPCVSQAATPTPELVSGAQLYERSDEEFASAIVIDATSGKRLYAYLPTLKWPAASLTKLMTALVTLDQKPSWHGVIALQKKDEVGGGRLRVKSGATMSMNDLWYSTIVASANNAAMALARSTGLSAKNFVKQMNSKALQLGLASTTFVEPSGMDPKNVTTAQDLAVLAKHAFSAPPIQRAASTSKYTFVVRNTSEKKTLTNTNALLTVDPDVWVYGGKTGFLYESRNNLVVKLRSIPESPEKPPLTIVVLGSPSKADMFKTAKGLANWAWRAYKW